MVRSTRSWCAGVALASLGYLATAWAGTLDHGNVGSSGLALSAARDAAAIAKHWAPIHYQDVDQTGRNALGGRADYITRYDFDGDLDGRNNFDNASKFSLNAHAYYSVVETSTHWFIVYMFFHPRDWADLPFDQEHENDSEGVLLSVNRDGSTFGALRSAVTVAHRDFFSFVPAKSGWSSGQESVDGTLQMARFEGSLHPVTAQQAKGHGLKARRYYDIDGDGVVYYPSDTVAEVPSGPDDRNVRYKLVDIFAPGGLWDQRNNKALFAAFGNFAGDKSGGCGAFPHTCSSDSANAPWGWDDSDDGAARGALARDPAGLVRNYFSIPEAVSTAYSHNPYR